MLKGKFNNAVKSSVFQQNKKIYFFLTGMTAISLLFYSLNFNPAFKATVKKWDFIECLRMKNVLGINTTPSSLLTESKYDESHITRQSSELGRSTSSTERSTKTTTVSHPVSKTGKPKHTHGPISLESELNQNTDSKRTASTELESTHTPSFSQSSVSSPEPMKYLVNSEICKIPDYDLLYPGIRDYIEFKEPLDCSDYPALTYTYGNVLIMKMNAARGKRYKDITCCYRALYRDGDGKSDEKYKFSSACNPMYKVTNISDEFIKVECRDNVNGSVFYQNFHSFIQEKPAVEERCEDSAGEYSILILGLDTMSRMNMHRQLRETVAYLYENLDPVEMYGYNKVGDDTFPNLIPLLTGYSEKELSESCWEKGKPFDDCDFIWKAFAEKGYRTLFAEDCYYISTFNFNKVGFYKQPVDYYFRPFIKAYELALGRRIELNTNLCLGPISQVQATLHWIKEFALRFKNKRYFSYSWINTYTHDFLNAGSAVDIFYADFFRILHTSGALDDTIVIFVSDHGMRWGVPDTPVVWMEGKLPMLLIMLPKRFRESHPKEARNLVENSHRLVTAFDLHATFQHLLHIDKEWKSVNVSNVPFHIRSVFKMRAQSLLLPISENRSCEDAHIDEKFCTCV